jgi:hypothetical protein
MSDEPSNTAPEQAPATDGGAAATEAPARSGISRRRRWLVNGLIAFTTVLAIFTMLSVFANRLLFNPDNWASTSTQLLQNQAIRSQVSNFLVDQLYANVNVAGLLKTALPPRLEPLAGPAAGALRGGAVKAVDGALQRPRIQTLWSNANRRADQALVAIVNGGKGAVSTTGGVVTLDLHQVLETVSSRLGLPGTILAKLPPNAGQLTLFKSSKISLVEDVGNGIRKLALLFSILVPVLWVLAVALTRGRRRRTLMSIGFSMVIAGLIGVVARHILQTGVTNTLVSDEAARPAVRATIGIGTQILGEIAIAFVFVGVIVALSAWFAGPARIAFAGRRAIAPFLRERPGWTYAIVGVVMLLFFLWQPIHAAGTPVGIIVFLCLAALGTETLRRQTAREFPDAQLGDASAGIRGRVDAIRQRREDRGAAAPTDSSLPAQLEQLVTLRDSGAISASEYDAAKANLLHA